MGPITPIQIYLLLLYEEGSIVLELDGILEVRTEVLSFIFINEFLIRWRNLLEDEVVDIMVPAGGI
jgi:hypothetical protein